MYIYTQANCDTTRVGIVGFMFIILCKAYVILVLICIRACGTMTACVFCLLHNFYLIHMLGLYYT